MKSQCSEIQTVRVSVVIEANSKEEALQKFLDCDYEESDVTEECIDSCNSEAVVYIPQTIRIFSSEKDS